MKKELMLSDKQYFDLFIGNRVLKSEVFNSEGKIPVFSSNVMEPFGYLNASNLGDFNRDYILWGIDGNFEFNLIKNGTRFATTDHCGIINILDKNILPEYVLYCLDLQKYILGFDRTLRPSLKNMEKVTINIPLKKDGSCDMEKQKEIIQKFNSIKKIKQDLNFEIEEISGVTVDIKVPEKNILNLKIEEIFDLNETTNSSEFTKSFINQNKGEIPVYSASKNPVLISYGYVKDNLSGVKYFANILTWNIDGSVGKAFFREGRFSLSEKVIPLILFEKWKGKISNDYVKYVLEKKAIEQGFAFTNKAGKSRIKDIEIEIPLRDGLPDIDRQIELANKYKLTYSIRDKLIKCLIELKEISVEI